MMKKKIALLLAAVMTFSMFTTAFASGLRVGDPITGDGTVQERVQLPVPLLNAVGPTANNLNFLIDPFNIADLVIGDNVLDGANNEIIFTGGSVLNAINNSSVPVVLSTVLTVTDHANVNVVQAGGDVVRGVGNNIMFWLEPASANITTTPVAVTAPSNAFDGAGQVVPFTTGGTHVHFLLDARAHAPIVQHLPVTSPGAIAWEPVDGSTPNGVEYNIGGVFNHLANWSAINAGDVRISVTHTLNVVADNAAGIRLHDTIPSLVTHGTNITPGVNVAPVNLVDLPNIPTGGGDGHIYVGTGRGFRPGVGISAINNNYNTPRNFGAFGDITVIASTTLTVTAGDVQGTVIPFYFEGRRPDEMALFFTDALTPIPAANATITDQGVTLVGDIWDSFRYDNPAHNPMPIYLTIQPGSLLFYVNVVYLPPTP